MRKTSLYLDDGDAYRLRRLSEMEGRSQAEIIRAAIATYEAIRKGGRNFALTGAWEGDGTSIADVADEDLFRGFGE